MDWLFSLSGLVVGFIVGMTGVGGGSLMTPILVLLFGVAPVTAVGTDLLYAAITKSGGTVVHARNKTVDWRITGLLAAGSVPSALLTTWFMHEFMPDDAQRSAVLTHALGIALILTASALLFRRHILGFAMRGRASESSLCPNAPIPKNRAIITVVIGLVIGSMVTLTSVGAGALGVVALFLLFPNLPSVRIIGSDLAHAVPLTFVAGLGHAALGTVDWRMLGFLLLGSLPGIFLGSHLAVKIPERILRGSLATLLILIGAKLVA